jgi:hypothetical protein
MPLRLSPLLVVPAILLIAGCTTTNAPVSDPAPAAPAAPVAPPPVRPATPPPASPSASAPADARPATIKGSEESSALLDNFTAFIIAIDGQPVAAGRKGWNQPLNLSPGLRRLTVEFNRGSFFARTDLMVEARPGAAYELRQTNDAQVYGGHSFCEFWVVDTATGENLMVPKRAALEKLKTGG